MAAKAAAKERGSAAPLSNCPTPVPRQMSRNDDRRTDEVKTYIGRARRAAGDREAAITHNHRHAAVAAAAAAAKSLLCLL